MICHSAGATSCVGLPVVRYMQAAPSDKARWGKTSGISIALTGQTGLLDFFFYRAFDPNGAFF